MLIVAGSGGSPPCRWAEAMDAGSHARALELSADELQVGAPELPTQPPAPTDDAPPTAWEVILCSTVSRPRSSIGALAR